MLKIGLTGGIGSGKTTVAQMFEVLGIPVYYADEAAKRLMNTDKELSSSIKNTFGETAYKNDVLDRQYLASIVFNDHYKLELLNSFVHPATIRDAEEWVKHQTTSYVIKEAALLFESGAAEHLDHIIGVDAPIDVRIKRVMDRDGVNKEEVLKRINNQMDDDIKMKLCDFVLTNDEQQLLIPEVLELHQKLLKLAER